MLPLADMDALAPKSSEAGELSKTIKTDDEVAVHQVTHAKDTEQGEMTGMEKVFGLSEPTLEKGDSKDKVNQSEEKATKKKAKEEAAATDKTIEVKPSL